MQPSNNDLIIYSAFRPGPLNLYHLENGCARPITETSGLNYKPAVSPDGQWLVYTSEETGKPALYARSLVDPTSPPRRLLTGDHMEDSPVIYGQTLYFVSTRDGKADIFSIPFSPVQETKIQEAINLTKERGSCFNPAISPDGQWIAFCSNTDHFFSTYFGAMPPPHFKAGNIYLMRCDGTDFKRVSHNVDWDGSPTWSPDGKQIFFYSMLSGQPRLCQIDFASLQVTSVEPLLHRNIQKTAFAPDGRLAFEEYVGEKSFIASVDLKSHRPDLDYRVESDFAMDYFAPVAHPKSGWITHRRDAIIEPHFGGERPPSAKKPMGTGPNFVNKTHVRMPNGNLVTLIALRGYFPTMHPSKQFMIAYEDFGKIYQFDAEGNYPKHVYTVPEGQMGYGLNFSLDGKWFVTAIGRAFGANNTSGHIYKIDSYSFKAIDLTPTSMANNSFPSVGPNGEIIFSSTRDGHKNLYSMDSDGNNVQRLTYTVGIDAMPAISKCGTKIAFVSQRNGKNFNLYLLEKNPETHTWRERQLTDSVDSFAHPCFDETGQRIVLSTGSYGIADETPRVPIFCPQTSGEIGVYDLSDGSLSRMTENNWEDSLPKFG